MSGLAIGLAFLLGFGVGFSGVVVCGGLALLLRARAATSTIAATAMLTAATMGALWAQSTGSLEASRLETGGFEGTVRVVEGPFLTSNGQRFVVQGNASLGERLCAYAGPAPQPHVGDRLFVSGHVTLPHDLPDIGSAALRARNCTAQLSAEHVVVVTQGKGLGATLSRFRTGLTAFLMQAAPGDAGALLSGLVTGDDGGLTRTASSAFLSSGTTHVTAISGANFAMLVLLLGVMATGAMKRSIWFVGTATAVIWLFALMVGLQPSALRAALLASAVLLGRRLGRVPDLLTLTVLLACAQILVRPHDFDTLAFRLSIAATVALIVVFDGSERFGERSWGASLALSVMAAQLATLPILAATMGTMSGVGLLANLLVGPLASLAFPIALLGGLVGSIAPWIGEIVLLPAIWLANLMIAFVEWTDRHLPGTVQLGEPIRSAIALMALACWLAIFTISGDLRRMARHASAVVRNW